jgi:hypothetical protein
MRFFPDTVRQPFCFRERHGIFSFPLQNKVAHVLHMCNKNNRWNCHKIKLWRFIMTTSERHETMQRKPILMPPQMISKVEKIARGKNVSFAEVVRDAVNAFNGEQPGESRALLEALADTMIQTTQEVVMKIEAVEKRLNETHAMLEGRQ